MGNFFIALPLLLGGAGGGADPIVNNELPADGAVGGCAWNGDGVVPFVWPNVKPPGVPEAWGKLTLPLAGEAG